MAFQLDGSLGAVSTGAVAASVTPAFAQPPGAGDILILWCSTSGGAARAAVPAGWKNLVVMGSSAGASIFWRNAAGGDAAPTITGVASAIISAQLGAFTREPVIGIGINESPVGTGTGATIVVGGQKERTPAQLIVYCGTSTYTVAATSTNNVGSITNGGTGHDTNNNNSSSTAQFVFGYCLNTAANVATQSLTYNQTITNISAGSFVWASFMLATFAPPLGQRMPLGA